MIYLDLWNRPLFPMDNNYGQQWMPIEQGPENSKRPKGMPPLSEIKTETVRLGLPESDAEALFDAWLANGYKTGRHVVRDWRAVVRNWKRNGWFPSLKIRKPVIVDHKAEQREKMRRMKDARDRIR